MADRYEDRRTTFGDTPAEPTAKDGDPLAELAKLIGQTDPFANFGRSNPTHPLRRDNALRQVADAERRNDETDDYFDREIFDEAPSPPAWVQHRNEAMTGPEPLDEPDLNARPHPLHRFAHQNGGEGAEADAQYADGQYPDAHYGQDSAYPQQPYQDDPYDYGDPPDPAREKSRRGLLTVAAVLGLAVIGTGGAFAYRTYVSAPRTGGGSVPVIKADPAPIKVVPPTTADAANKLIQDRLGTPGTETVVPREEQPVDVRDPSKAGARSPAATLTAKAPSAGTVPSPATGPSALPNGDEPKKVRTFSVKGDQADAGAGSPKLASRPTPPPAPPAPPARPQPAPGPTASLNTLAAPSSSGPMSINPRAPGIAPAAPTAAVPVGYVVQVSSQRSEADAQASYRSLQAKFPSVLGSRSANIKRADLGEKGIYYRAVLGPFSSAEDAAALCGNLKSAGGQCVIQRN